jgi:hypothetical protein
MLCDKSYCSPDLQMLLLDKPQARDKDGFQKTVQAFLGLCQSSSGLELSRYDVL